MKIEKFDKKFLIDCLQSSCSIFEYGQKTGISNIDHIKIQNVVGEYIGIDIKKVIEQNNINKKLIERQKFLDQIVVCDNCGNEYRNGDRLTENKSGRHFCCDYCAKQFSSKHGNTIEKRKEKSATIKQKFIDDYKKNIRICPICKKQIPYDKRDRKTCSKKCGLILMGRNISKTLKGNGKTGGYHENSSRGKRGHYKGIFCASTYELAFLIYCLDHNIPIKRNLKGYEYIWNGEKHLYYPDWLVNNDHLVETKNFITEQVLIKAKSVNDYPIEIMDTKMLMPIFEYVSKTYNKKFSGRYNNFYELYDEWSIGEPVSYLSV